MSSKHHKEIDTQILKGWHQKIERSKLSVNEFFRQHQPPFSCSFYYKQIRTGKITTKRMRGAGGCKLTHEQEAYLRGLIKLPSNVTLIDCQKALKEDFGEEISTSTISRFLKSKTNVNLSKGRPHSVKKADEINQLGGFELIVALAHHLNFPLRSAELIKSEVDKIKQSNVFQKNQVDSKGRSPDGKFTKAYNKRKDVRQNKFNSIDNKRELKNWASMNLFRDDLDAIMRKVLALLSLPVITNNGGVRTVGLAFGQNLNHLCGFNYKQSTINKFMSELKYLGVSDVLLSDLAKFWLECWGQSADNAPQNLLCYYIDGNTKAMWSSQRIRKNKVTMLGRVMGCLEQVFIHDGMGNPIYVETFSGHAPAGEYVLEMFEKIESVISEVPKSNTNVCRAIIMDAASNSVKTLRAFAAQNKYFYITPLDKNQWSERKILKKLSVSRYSHENASLTDMFYEMKDSNEKGYLLKTRAVKISWDNGKETVLLTNLEPNIVDASTVVTSYFHRWPAQELQFRQGKKIASIHRVAGYGRKEFLDPKAAEKQLKLKEDIDKLSNDLNYELGVINDCESDIAAFVAQEQGIREKCQIIRGRLVIPKALQTKYMSIGHFKKNLQVVHKGSDVYRKNQGGLNF